LIISRGNGVDRVDHDRLIEIKLPKCTVFLTQNEIQALLRNDVDIWKESLKRGKYILRNRKQKQRERNEI
jgi:hypothetical protein